VSTLGTITRAAIRKRHPGLRRKNQAALDRAIRECHQAFLAFYLIGTGDNNDNDMDVILEPLDEPARVALIDYFERLPEIIKEHLKEI